MNFQYKHAALRLTFVFAGLILSGVFVGCCFAADKNPSVQGGAIVRAAMVLKRRYFRPAMWKQRDRIWIFAGNATRARNQA